MRHSTLAILLLCYVLFGATSVQAQQVSLSISPPLLEATIKPGKSILIAYKIENLGDPVILKAKILPFIPKGNQGSIQLMNEFEGPIKFNLDNADLQLEQPFFLKSRDSQQILLYMQVPEGAPEGDYYYTLLVETQPPPSVEGITSSRAQVSLGSNILLTITESGKSEIKGKISLFDVLPSYTFSFLGRRIKIIDSNDVISIIIQIENQGKNLIKPNGEILLRGNFGEKATYSLLPQNILTQSQRVILATPSASLDCSKCTTPHSLLIKGFFLGKYNLSTSVNFGDGTPNLYASTWFLAIPIKFIVGLSIVFLVLIGVISRYRTSSRDF